MALCQAQRLIPNICFECFQFYHLATFINSGELPLESFVPKNKIENIQNKYLELGAELGVKPIKESLGDGYSYAEIRGVVNYLKFQG